MDKFVSNNENNYLYYYDATNPNIKDLKLYLNAARSHSNSGAKFLVTSDTQLLEELGSTDTKQSLLVLLQDHNTKKIPYTKSLSSESDLNKWISQTKYPLFTEISSQNSEEIMDNHDLVVIGFINSNTVNTWTPKFREVARKWRASELADTHNVVFTWIDSDKWSKYISKVYHLEPTDLPRIIFTKPD
ncbi:hypothetical protein PIROE2DRAFT_3044, partial [Piromyces sp. E2]